MKSQDKEGKQKMKRCVVISVLAILMLLFSAPLVFAGSINGPEAGLISKASGTFQYEGKTYAATPQALGQLKAYLSRDDIDLTQEQADRAASMMYSNVEGGVLDGYLMPVGGSAAVDSGSNSVLNRPEKKDKDRQKNRKQEKAGKASVTVTEDRSGLQVISPDGEAIFEAELPVKDTGVALGLPYFVMVMLLLCIPAGIGIAWKLKLFTQKNES